MSLSKYFAVAALLSLGAAASSHAIASETESTGVAACTTGRATVFRSVGHPAKSALLSRHVQLKPLACKRLVDNTRPMLASFLDAEGGTALVRGHAVRAIQQIESAREHDGSAVLLNNLCVARTVLRQFAEARVACDAAVTTAQRELDSRNSRWAGEARRLARKVSATAFSNRAVMHWLAQDVLAAQGDYERARQLAPKSPFVERNVDLGARLPARIEVAPTPVG
jgi:hypothetical protein